MSEVSDLVSGRSVISSVFVVGALGLKVSSVSEVSDLVSVPGIAIFAQGRALCQHVPVLMHEFGVQIVAAPCWCESLMALAAP